jgi:hypothetical protein
VLTLEKQPRNGVFATCLEAVFHRRLYLHRNAGVSLLVMAMVSTRPTVPKPVVARYVIFDDVFVDVIKGRIDITDREGVRRQVSHGRFCIQPRF